MSLHSATELLAYWLIPAEPAGSYFRSLISNLADRFDAPVFEPHLTIYVTENGQTQPDTVLGNHFKNHGPYRLSVRGLDHSDKFTKTVFVQFEPDTELARMNAELRRASAVQSDYELNPHLSLIYKTMGQETKRDLVASINVPFDEVHFDSLKAVISPAKIESRADVEAWRVVAEQELSG